MNWQVSVVIPCWNGLEALKESLPAILKLKGVFEWILVDDASSDGSTNWVKENFPKVRVINQPKNGGFPLTANTGVKIAKGDLVAIINHDLIPKQDAIVNTLVHFSKPNIFGVTLRETNELGGGIVTWQDGWLKLSAAKVTNKPQATFWGSGGETIYKKKMWNLLGGYDLIYSPGYWEDVDLGLRARRRGWKMLWEPSAVITSSVRGASFAKLLDTKSLIKIKERNRLLVIWMNILSGKLIKEHIYALVKRALTHPGYLFVIFAAITKLNIIIIRRNIERREGKLTDEQVFSRSNFA